MFARASRMFYHHYHYNDLVKISSSCRYQYASMLHASAAKSTPTTPWTNIPIHCPPCPVGPSGSPATIWKYNTMVHLLTAHRDEAGDIQDITPQLVVEMHISRAEESAMGIGEEYTD